MCRKSFTNSTAACWGTVALALGLAVSSRSARAQDTIQTFAGGGPNNLNAVPTGSQPPNAGANLNQPTWVAVDTAGNLYIAAPAQNRIFKVDTSNPAQLTVLAGNGTPGSGNECTQGNSPDCALPAHTALHSPQAVAVDSNGNVFIADSQNNVIRVVNTQASAITVAGVQVQPGAIATVAGNGGSGFSGDGGPALQAELAGPFGLVIDSAGDIYIADIDNNRVREVYNANGYIATVAGNGALGFSGDGGPALAASLNQPMSVALDNSNPPNLYIGDGGNHRIRRVDQNGVITTYAGNGTSGAGGDGGPAISASLGGRLGLAFDNAADLYIADGDSGKIRVVSAGVINTVAGNGCFGYSLETSDCKVNPSGGDGNPATSASLNGPLGVVLDGSGNLYIADTGNLRIRAVNMQGSAITLAGVQIPSGDIETLAGNGLTVGGDGSPPADASLISPQGVALDAAGNVFIADTDDNLIRVMNTQATAVTVAGIVIAPGTLTTVPPSSGLNGPTGVAVDGLENVFIADTANQRLLKVDLSGNVTTVAGTSGAPGSSGDGSPAANALLNFPSSVALDSAGNVYIADTDNHRIRAVNLGATSVTVFGVLIPPGDIETVAGSGTPASDPTAACGETGLATSAQLSFPEGIAFDNSGNLYIADRANQCIREVDPAGNISTLAGDGTQGFSGDGGAATSAELNLPSSVAVDSNGNLYIADFGNQAVRRVDFSSQIITTVAGVGVLGFSGDGGPAYLAMLATPSGVAFDASGNLLIADTLNGRIRKVTSPAVPAVSFSPPSLSFTDQLVGAASLPQTSTVTNTGNSVLSISGITILTRTGASSPDFSETSTCSAPVPPGGSCNISVTFLPTAPGTTIETLTVTDNDEGGSQSVTLTGSGSFVLLSPLSLNFGQQVVGMASSSLSIMLENSSTSPLSIIGLTVSGADASDFAPTNGCGSVVQPQNSCSLSVTFTPAATGVRRATLNVADNAAGSPQAIPLTGTGTFVSLSPAVQAFGNQLVGSTSAQQVLTLTNDGNAPLNITSIYLTGDFGQSNNCPSTLTSGASCSIMAVFKPSFAGAQVGSLFVTDSDPASPQSAELTGTGVQSTAVLSSTSLLFLDETIGTTSSSQGVTLSNGGSLPLTINSLAIIGDYAQTNNCPIPPAFLAPGAGCVFSVTFTPTAGGARNGSLTISESADPNTPRIVSLTGNGVGPGISLSQSSVSFTFSQEVGTTSQPYPLVLSSNGTTALTISSIATTGDFGETNNCASSLPPSMTCTVNVTFTPSAAGARSGTLVTTDNVGGSPQIVALMGTGYTQPSAAISPTSVIFTNQLVGTNSGAQAVTLQNPGTAALAITSIMASSSFSETNTCGTSLAVGATCTVNVVFSPTTTGTTTGTLTFIDNAANSPQTVPLTGTGIAPTLALSPASLSFGNQGVTTTSAPLSVALTSTGTAALQIGSITTTGDFAQTNNCGASVPPPTTCTITVTFTPTATGPRSGILTITDSAADSPQTVALTGTGVGPSFSLSQTSLVFQNSQGVGTTSGALPLALSSTSTAPLTINSIVVTGDFAQTNNCPAPPQLSTNCTINVAFTPTATGSRSGTLTIASNVAGSPSVIPLSGTGVIAYAMTVDRTSATILSGTSSVVLNVSATSAFNFAGSITLSCTGNPAPACAFNPASITVGQNSVLTVSGLGTQPSGSINFTVIGTNGSQAPSETLTITIADYTISASSTTATVTAGQAATYTLKIQPSGGFNQQISLNCTGAPLAATCSVSPFAVTPDGTDAVSTTVTVTTTALATAHMPGPFTTPWPRMPTPLLWLASLLLASAVLICARRRRGLVRYLLVVCVAAILTWAACGGGSQLPLLTGTPSGTYTLTVSSISSSLSHSVSLTLTVN